MVDTPLFQRVERTLYGYELHKSLPMTTPAEKRSKS